MWHQLHYVDSSRKWFSVNELKRNLVIEYSYYGIHAVVFFFFPPHDRENNANLETFCLIVALEVTNSNSVCASGVFTDQTDFNENHKSMTKLSTLIWFHNPSATLKHHFQLDLV